MEKYRNYPKATYGTTIHTLNEKTTREYEPYAATINERIHALRTAKELGIKTWVSVEPVIDPTEALNIIIHDVPKTNWGLRGKQASKL